MSEKLTKVDYLTEVQAKRDEIKALTERYIEDNKVFNVGDRVDVTEQGKTQKGIVTENKLNYENTVYPSILRLKNSGEPSLIGLLVCRESTIKLSEQ